MRLIDNYSVYKKSHQLTLELYRVSKKFPKEELYGLTSQIRRSVASIPMNLKEGGVGSESFFHKYVRIALGSKEELEYQLLLARDLNYISQNEWLNLHDQITKVGRMLNGILNKKNENSNNPGKETTTS